ncbi:MAG: ATPase synthesis protein 25 mitochondrial [Bogoriella megaspora]|nr:MAG: ATPase synthesis protein 25 mitochondrial [Bogoriella megaspora]
MLIARHAQATLRCSACRFNVIAAFAASAGVELPSKISRTSPSQKGYRPFASPAILQEPSNAVRNRGDNGTLTDPTWPGDVLSSSVKAEVELEQQDVSSTGTYVPWYLQENTSPVSPEQHPFNERQRIPGLPDNAPPLLQPILEHISKDLGLDDLSLLDLRGLDPPPALGDNLIMVIGTARSEKHLHVSADRHCRWLRSNYKLHPFADGLLGRNELKLKQRRAARHSKMMRNAGASDPGTLDDGIRSGWICVNIGRIQPAETETAAEGQSEIPGIVGFGTRSEGVRLVVQMFTEESRGHFDLETLWGGKVRRVAKERQKEIEETVQLASENEHGEYEVEEQHEQLQTTWEPPFDHPRSSNSSSHPQLGFRNQQVRAYHSSSIRHYSTDRAEVRSDDYLETSLPLQHSTSAPQGDAFSSIPHLGLSTSENLGTLVAQFLNASPAKAKELLGGVWPMTSDDKGEGADASGFVPQSKLTPFMAEVVNNFPPFPDTAHWESMMLLAHRGVEVGGLSPSDLMNTLHGMRRAGEVIPVRTYLSILETLIKLDSSHAPLSDAFELLDMMVTDGYPILSESVFLILHQTVAPPDLPAISSTAADEDGYPARPTAWRRPQLDVLKNKAPVEAEPDLSQSSKTGTALAYQERLLAIMDHFAITFNSDAPYLSMLRSYASARQYPAFLFLWSSLPRRMRPRSQTMYVLMFKTLAESGDGILVKSILTDAVRDMQVEEPPVELKGNTAQAITECLEVAFPDIAEWDHRGQLDRKGIGEWADLWRKCQRVLKRMI